MRQTLLPGTQLNVSVLGLGCWAFGGQYWGDDVRDEDSVATIHAALDAGITLFDTAPLYGQGHADRVLRRALGPRIREVVVATKVGVRPQGRDGHAESDLRPEHILADAEASLQRLGLERIDLLQIHWPCQHGTPLSESLGALETLQAQGKIRTFGLCNYGVEALREARGLAPVATLQTPYSLLRREAEGGLDRACEALGVGLIAYEPLCRGLLSGRLLRERIQYPPSDLRSRDDRFQGAWLRHNLALVGDLDRAAQRLGVPTAALSLGWVLSRPRIAAALVGAKRPAQLREDIQALRLLDKARVWGVVDQIAAIHGGWSP